MGYNHHLPFDLYLQFITTAPIDDIRWTREIRKYLVTRADQRKAYYEWLNSGDVLSEWYKLTYE